MGTQHYKTLDTYPPGWKKSRSMNLQNVDVLYIALPGSGLVVEIADENLKKLVEFIAAMAPTPEERMKVLAADIESEFRPLGT